MTDELRALIARLEAATEGSRELDAEIAWETGWAKENGSSHALKWHLHYRRHIENGSVTWRADHYGVPNYTTSIDAALTLVPDHMTIHMNERLEGVAGAHVMLIGPSGPFMSDSVVHGEAHLHTLSPLTDFRPVRSLLPLALCIASLRARMR